MTILEWLTPDFFALNVILVALLINLTIYAAVSNFTEDFKMGEKLQAVIFTAVIGATVIYAAMVIMGFTGIIPRFPYLYENKYNFLLLGKGPVFGGNGPVLTAILLGIAISVPAGIKWGDKKGYRAFSGIGALICDGVIVAMTLLWIINQT